MYKLPWYSTEPECPQVHLNKFPVDFQDLQAGPPENFLRQISGDFYGHLFSTEHSLSLFQIFFSIILNVSDQLEPLW